MANPNPSPSTRFKKGQVGNPTGYNGRQSALTKILREQADQLCATKDGKTMTRAEAVAQVVWKLAISDQDLKACEFIYERLDGKVPNKLQVEGAQINFALDDEIVEPGCEHNGQSNGQTSQAPCGPR